MDFGVTLPNFGKYADKSEITKIAATAEAMGFDSVWVSDHIVIPDSHEGFGDIFYDPLVTISFLASKTQKIKLGTSVIIIPYRNPVVLAKMISTLDQLSEGRIILGVGTGWLKEEFDALGVTFSGRGEITNEYLKALKVLWRQESPAFHGKYLNFSNFRFLPKTIQQPHPPIWVGGGSNKAIERAVIYGDGWQPVGLTPEKLKEKLITIDAALRSRKKKNFVISLRRNLEITDKDIDENDTLRGPIEKIVTGLKEYKDLGVNHLLLHFLSGTSQGVIKSMKRFSEEIRPLI